MTATACEPKDRFNQVVQPHLPNLFKAARRILPGDDLAWDAVQETLVRLWVRGWLPPDPEKALLHLVRRSSLHQLRCLRRRRYHEAEAAAACEVCCPDDPLGALDQTERVQAIRAALAHVSEDFRSVFELFVFDQESYETIASRLGVSVGTVRSRLSRTRAMLQRSVGRAAP